MLTFAEEIYLLALDDVTGTIPGHSTRFALHGALVGAALCELCFMNRLDADPGCLYVVDATPTGNPVLDRILSVIAAEDCKMGITEWISALIPEGHDISHETLRLLLEKKILKEENRRVLWMFPTRRYPMLDDSEIQDVERRLRGIILEGEVPSPRDAVLISLIHACNLFEEVLSPRDCRRAADRIETLSKLDMVASGVAETIRQITAACISHPGTF